MWYRFRYFICTKQTQWIRAARVTSVEDANLAKLHNNANVLVMGGRQVNIEQAKAMIDEYINTEYEGGRHQARIDQIDKF